MIKRFLIALLLIVPLISEAQTSGVDTLRWSVSGFRDLNTSADVVSASEFLISGSGKIKWIQDGGNFVNPGWGKLRHRLEYYFGCWYMGRYR